MFLVLLCAGVGVVARNTLGPGVLSMNGYLEDVPSAQSDLAIHLFLTGLSQQGLDSIAQGCSGGCATLSLLHLSPFLSLPVCVYRVQVWRFIPHGGPALFHPAVFYR